MGRALRFGGLWAGLALALLGACAKDEAAEVWAAYQAAHAALEAGDLETLRTLVTGEHAASFEGEQAQVGLELARAMLPQGVERVGLVVDGDTATLTLRGHQIHEEGVARQKIPAEGSVKLRREDGVWKIAKEDWTMKMELSASDFGVESFAREGQRIHPQLVLTGHADAPTQLVSTPDGLHLVSASYGDYTLRVWDLREGRQLSLLTLEQRPTSLALGPGGDHLIVAGAQKTVWKIPLDAAGQLGAPEALLQDAGSDASPSPDGKWLATTSWNAPIVVHDFATRAPVYTLEGSEKLRSSRFAPDGSLLVGSEGNQLFVWNTQDWSAQAYSFPEVAPESSNGAPVFSADGRYVGIPCGDSSIVVFDIKERKVLHDFFVSGAAALALAFAPDGQQFATAQNNQQINLWGMQDHARVNYILGKKSNAQALLFSGDGRFLVAGYEDREIVAWRAFDPGEKPPVQSVAPVAAGGGDAEPAPAAPADLPGEIAAGELLGEANYLPNSDAGLGEASWEKTGNAEIEPCRGDDRCFTTRYDGQFVGTALLPGSASQRFLLLIGRASAERVREPGSADQSGESYLHGYGEPLDPSSGIGEHYSAETLMTQTQAADTWSTLSAVFPLDPKIRRLRLTLRQADGHSAKNGSASRFDDLGVLVFDTADEAQAFVQEYDRVLGAQAAQSESGGGSDILSCRAGGRVIFTSRARCAQLGGTPL